MESISWTPKRKKHASRTTGKLQRPLSGTRSQGEISTFEGQAGPQQILVGRRQRRVPDLLAPAADVEQPACVGIEDPEHPLIDVAVSLPARDDGEQSPREVQRHVRRILRLVLEPRQVPQPERCIPQVPLQGFGKGHQDRGDARAGQHVGRHEGGALGGEVAGVVGELAPQPAGLPPTSVGGPIAEAHQQAQDERIDQAPRAPQIIIRTWNHRPSRPATTQ